MPVSDERVLMKLLSKPVFAINVEKESAQKIRNNLMTTLPTIGFETIVCRKKSKNELNIKPIDPADFNGLETVHVYSIRDHLALFLNNEKLSSALIFKPVSNSVLYSSFVSGQYFHNITAKLLAGVLPLCCKCT